MDLLGSRILLWALERRRRVRNLCAPHQSRRSPMGSGSVLARAMDLGPRARPDPGVPATAVPRRSPAFGSRWRWVAWLGGLSIGLAVVSSAILLWPERGPALVTGDEDPFPSSERVGQFHRASDDAAGPGWVPLRISLLVQTPPGEGGWASTGTQIFEIISLRRRPDLQSGYL